MATPRSARNIAARINDIRTRLGSARKELSYQGLADEIFERTKFRVSGKALTLYGKGSRVPPVPVIAAIAAVDPLKRGPAWLAGWEEAAHQPATSDARGPQKDPETHDSPAGPLKSSLPYYRKVSEDRPSTRRKRGA